MLNWFEKYVSSPTHKWWVDNVWRPTWTKALTAVYGIPAALLGVWNTLANFSNDNTITMYLAKLNVPNWLPMALAGVALVHYIASGRK